MQIYEWDFSKLNGLVVKQKFESLINLIIEAKGQTQGKIVMGHPQIMALIEPGINKVHVPLGNFVYIGEFIGMSFYQSNDMPTYELMISGPTDNAIIKITNVFEYGDDD